MIYIFVKIIVKLITFFIYVAIYARNLARFIRDFFYKVRSKFREYKFRAYIRQELEKCPDEVSKSKRFDEIRRAWDERSMQIEWHRNIMARLYVSLAELYKAFYVNFKYLKDETITKEQYDNSPSQFQHAKEQMLINARWALGSVSNKDSLEELISIVEPICIDDFDTYREWTIFQKSVERIMHEETQTFLDQYSSPSV